MSESGGESEKCVRVKKKEKIRDKAKGEERSN